MLTGGGDTDSFIFTNGFGIDQITDFANDGLEKINLSGITDFTDLQNNHLTEVNSRAVITDGANAITLVGVRMSDLTDSDFEF